MEVWRQADYEVSTDPARLDTHTIRAYLRTSYWAAGIPLEIVEEACRNSLCFGLYHAPETGESAQVGFARVVTDYATFAWLADVFVLERNRGVGLSKWMMECVMAHPQLAGLRRWMLATRDAHTLYTRFGFTPLGDPRKFMEIARPGLYLEAQTASNSSR